MTMQRPPEADGSPQQGKKAASRPGRLIKIQWEDHFIQLMMSSLPLNTTSTGLHFK